MLLLVAIVVGASIDSFPVLSYASFICSTDVDPGIPN